MTFFVLRFSLSSKRKRQYEEPLICETKTEANMAAASWYKKMEDDYCDGRCYITQLIE